MIPCRHINECLSFKRGKDGCRCLEGLSEVSEVEIMRRVCMGAAIVLSCRKCRKWNRIFFFARSPGHDFARGCNERIVFLFCLKISISQRFTNMSHGNQFHKIAIMFMFQTFVHNVACQPKPTCQQFSELGGCQRFVTIFRMRLWVDDWWEPTNGNLKHGSANN